MHDLETSFGYQIRRLQLEVDRRARQALDPFDMTPARVTALLVISTRPGCTQTALGDALSINRASAMKMVNVLEGQGLVTREAASDPRAHALVLTAKGNELLAHLVALLRQVDEDVLARLGTDARRELVANIRQLTAQATAGQFA